MIFLLRGGLYNDIAGLSAWAPDLALRNASIRGLLAIAMKSKWMRMPNVTSDSLLFISA